MFIFFLRKLSISIKMMGQGIVLVILITKVYALDNKMDTITIEELLNRPMLIALAVIAFGSILEYVAAFSEKSTNQ